jgi:hypothetical protein
MSAMMTQRYSVYAVAFVFMLLSALHATAASVQLAWDSPPEPADGSRPFIVAGYKLYYGPFNGQDNGHIEGVIDVGRESFYLLTGLEPAKTYFFAVTATDSAGDESGFSNIVITTTSDTAADTAGSSQAGGDQHAASGSNATSTDADSGDAAVTWGAGGHTDQVDEPESHTDDFDHLPTVTWMNYRLSLTLGSAHRDDIGVMFHYQDQNNYYRFVWSDQHGQRRLEKRQQGMFMLMAEDRLSSAPVQPYELTIVAADEALQVWIDGMLVFSVADDTFFSGAIALYAAGQGDNFFDNVLVEDLGTESVLLWDDFTHGMNADCWTIVEEDRMADRSQWSADTGVLIQRAGLDADSLDSLDRTGLGTFALFRPY